MPWLAPLLPLPVPVPRIVSQEPLTVRHALIIYCGLGDPALDLAWTRYGAGPVFAAALETAYSPEADVLARGLDWHLLGPWHEVTYGLDTGQPSYVESGLAGAVRRLQESTR
jgi:hypothetical protein